MRPPLLLIAASAVTAASAADPVTLVLPQTLHQPVGATTALRGGTAYALGEEAGATWYNPALAATIDPDQVSAGATAYGFNRIEVSADRESSTLLDGAVLKVYGGMSGRSADGTLGWSAIMCNPMHWSGAVDNGRSEPTATERGYATHVRIEQDTWAVQLALGWKPSETFQCGVGLAGFYDSLDLSQSLWTRDIAGRSSSASFIASTWSTSLQPKIGMRWLPLPGLTLGLAVVAPAVTIIDGGLVSETIAASDPVAGTAQSIDVRANDDAFRFVHPWQVGIGAGWSAPTWDTELALAWTLPDASHETVPQLNGFRSVTAAGITTIQPATAAARTTSYRHVVNLRAAGSAQLTESMTLQVGGFSDISPVQESTVYNRIDFFGVTGGVVIRRRETGFILGVSATWGNEQIDIYNPATDSTRPGQIRVFAMDLVVGTVSKF